MVVAFSLFVMVNVTFTPYPAGFGVSHLQPLNGFCRSFPGEQPASRGNYVGFILWFVSDLYALVSEISRAETVLYIPGLSSGCVASGLSSVCCCVDALQDTGVTISK